MVQSKHVVIAAQKHSVASELGVVTGNQVGVKDSETVGKMVS